MQFQKLNNSFIVYVEKGEKVMETLYKSEAIGPSMCEKKTEKKLSFFLVFFQTNL